MVRLQLSLSWRLGWVVSAAFVKSGALPRVTAAVPSRLPSAAELRVAETTWRRAAQYGGKKKKKVLGALSQPPSVRARRVSR